MRKSITKILLQSAISSIAGTSAMTFSSWLMSLSGEDFREPEHLGTMAHRLLPLTSKNEYTAIGWAGHYCMGIAFASSYGILWERYQLRPSLKNGLLLGIASGVLGSAIWKATFKIHPLPPRLNYNLFYLQRLPAHVVFALATTIVYKAITAKRAKKHNEMRIEETIEKGQKAKA